MTWGDLGRSQQPLARRQVVSVAIAATDAISFPLRAPVKLTPFLCLRSFGDSEAAGRPHRAPDGAVLPAKRGGESPLPISAPFPFVPRCRSPLLSPAFLLWV